MLGAVPLGCRSAIPSRDRFPLTDSLATGEVQDAVSVGTMRGVSDGRAYAGSMPPMDGRGAQNSLQDCCRPWTGVEHSTLTLSLFFSAALSKRTGQEVMAVMAVWIP